MKKPSLRILPATAAGKWAVGLIIAMPILFFLGTSFTNTLYASVPSGNSILEDLAARPALALTMLAGMVAGVSAFIVGLFALIRQKENALLVILSTVVGGFLILFLAGEFIFPH